jgi:prolyl oligopeptidase
MHRAARQYTARAAAVMICQGSAMKPLIAVVALAAVLLTLSAALSANLVPPPATAVDSVTELIQGVRVADPYRWLENADDPKVAAWSDAQNARTRSYFDGLSSRGPLAIELKRLYTTTSPYYYNLVARGERVFAIYRDPKQQQPIIVALNAAAEPASRITVLDPNILDAKGLTAFDWFVPSPDGTRIAVSLSQNGSENGTLHVYDVASGKEIDAPIDRVQYATAGGSVAWTSDNRGFWYTRYPGPESPESERHFNMQVYLHRLGAPAANDPIALGTKHGLERISEITLKNTVSQSAVLASVGRGDGGQFAHFILTEDKPPIEVAIYKDQIVSATLGPDGALYGVSRAGALNGKVVKLSPPFKTAGLAHAPVIIPEGAISILTSAGAAGGNPTVAADRLYLRYINGGPTEVRLFDLAGAAHGLLPVPPISTNSEITPLSSGSVLFDVESYVVPLHYERFDPATNAATSTELKQLSSVTFDDAEVVRENAISKDGTAIPINIIRKKGTRLDGTNATLLYGYGGYGVSETPYFLGPVSRVWLDAGGVYATANIRGGSEFGERWHREGMLTKKQNVFDDFAAVAQQLIAEHYTSHARLALLGGSNGGLLMGALITQHPDLPRAVVSMVGIYDMLRVELDPNGSFNTTEFGTVKHAAEFKALYAYSPYHHVRMHTAYPAVLLMTGATDARVNPMQSRKFTAALQAASSADYPLLLRTNKTSGHGIGSSLDERIAERSDMLAFLFDQLGMTWSPAPH